MCSDFFSFNVFLNSLKFVLFESVGKNKSKCILTFDENSVTWKDERYNLRRLESAKTNCYVSPRIRMRYLYILNTKSESKKSKVKTKKVILPKYLFAKVDSWRASTRITKKARDLCTRRRTPEWIDKCLNGSRFPSPPEYCDVHYVK